MLLGNNGLPLDQKIQDAFIKRNNGPSASLVLNNNKVYDKPLWEIFGKPVSFPNSLHINVGRESYLLTPEFMRILITSNPYILNNMVENIDKLKYLKMVSEQLDTDPGVEADQKIRLVQTTTTIGPEGPVLRSEGPTEGPTEGPEGTGYKSQMKLRKQLQALHKRASKRRSIKKMNDELQRKKAEQDFAPLIDEIRKIERHIHDSSRIVKGKPIKVRDGTAKRSKKTGRIKSTLGKGGFSNSDAFSAGSRRKSVRNQAIKQVKEGTTFGHGLPLLRGLESKLMLLKGSQMAGNTGKKIKAEISKIEKKLK
jgi:hypothetical protein